MNIAIYARVSSAQQAKDGTINSQLEVLREYAQKESHFVIEECLDDGYSGADLNRPGLDHLRDLAADRIIDAVLVLSPDRIARKQAHQIILLEEFKKRNIQVIFSNQRLGDSAEDQLMLNIQGAISEYERAKILDRTRRGTKHAVRNGQVLGSNSPYGFKFVHKDNQTPAHWEINSQEAEIVKIVFDWYVVEELKGNTIAKRLHEEGYTPRTGKKWWPSVIHDILKNKTYTGQAEMYKTRSVEPKKHPKLSKYRKLRKSSKADRPEEDRIIIQVERIINQEIWEKAQQLRLENARKSPRNNKKNNYLVRGLMVCGLCGSMASGHVSNKNTYYSCGAKRNRNINTKSHDESVSVRHKSFDKKVWQGLVNLLDDPKNLKAQLEKRIDKYNIRSKQDTTTSDKLDSELEKLIVQESRVVDAYREGVIDLPELKEQKAKIGKRINVLEAKKKAALSQLEGSEQPEITMGILGDVSNRFQRVMANADFQTKEKLVNLLVNSVTLLPEKAIIEGNIPVIQGDALNLSNHASPLLLLFDPTNRKFVDHRLKLFALFFTIIEKFKSGTK